MRHFWRCAAREDGWRAFCRLDWIPGEEKEEAWGISEYSHVSHPLPLEDHGGLLRNASTPCEADRVRASHRRSVARHAISQASLCVGDFGKYLEKGFGGSYTIYLLYILKTPNSTNTHLMLAALPRSAASLPAACLECCI